MNPSRWGLPPPLESYIEKYSEASFSHSICSECSDKLYGEEDWYIEMKKDEKNQILYFIIKFGAMV